CMQGLEFPWTF
nr:immunoglobulin light chain junction region [Macaca mulatta]MOV34054.1 immunoglobulin light chain junction region [Macaca mulatta]MOV34070.1 immunoglobulin light chain junction region [Macaca mulatta]MOV34076.1 immunoglobulin light chain junction region [Macaca mulatta]MOV34080.1 immunoglobulin light chain junction region [Macaca mulatta]